MDKQGLLDHLRREGFPPQIIDIFSQVDREEFVPEEYRRFAYEDAALPIGHNQTISQPSTIAFMLELLELIGENQEKILEIGCGSGYVLALLSHLCPDTQIYGTERIEELAYLSKKRLKKYKNIKIFHTPNKVGVPRKRPFDRILVSASVGDTPYYIIEQLKDKGVLVCPIQKSIMKFKRSRNNIEKTGYFGFSFVPLIE